MSSSTCETKKRKEKQTRNLLIKQMAVLHVMRFNGMEEMKKKRARHTLPETDYVNILRYKDSAHAFVVMNIVTPEPCATYE